MSVGNWYKIAVTAPGVYKIDIAFLNALGITASSLPSNSIRLFGNGGQMLPESGSSPVMDDPLENACWAEDGGDGVLNGTDYLLFYAPGPHRWVPDATIRRFTHQKNLYSEAAYYYLTIGGTGLRITTLTTPFSPNTTITGFSERYHFELDTVNLLSSGRQWFEEDFADAPGKSVTRQYTVPLTASIAEPAQIRASCLSRSFGNAGRFSVSVNNQPVLSLDIPPVATGPYDQFARTVDGTGSFVPTPNEPIVRFDYTPGSANAQGWLDWFEIFTRRSLVDDGWAATGFPRLEQRGGRECGQFYSYRCHGFLPGLGSDQCRAAGGHAVGGRRHRSPVFKRGAMPSSKAGPK